MLSSTKSVKNQLYKVTEPMIKNIHIDTGVNYVQKRF